LGQPFLLGSARESFQNNSRILRLWADGERGHPKEGAK